MQQPPPGGYMPPRPGFPPPMYPGGMMPPGMMPMPGMMHPGMMPPPGAQPAAKVFADANWATRLVHFFAQAYPK
jgi:hypothetical protein